MEFGTWRFKRLLRIAAATLAVLVVGIPLTWWTVMRADHQMRAELLQQAHMISDAVTPDHIAALTGTEADLTSPSYEALKEQLSIVRSANPKFRFVYLLGRKTDGQLFFFVDSETTASKDYSPPGELYNEATDVDRAIFDANVPAVEGPCPDEWGTWVTALAPVGDSGNAPRAVLGVDVDASAWKDMLARAALPPALLTLTLVTLLSVGWLVWERTTALRIERENLKAIFASSPVGMMLLDEDTMIVDANSVLAGMVSRSRVQLLGQHPGCGLGCAHSLEHPGACGDALACTSCPLRASVTQVLRGGPSIRGAEIQAALLIGGKECRPWLSVSAEPVMLHGRRHIIVAVDDITARKGAQEALTSSMSLLNATLESTADGILVVDRKGQITRWNSKFADMWQVPPAVLSRHNDGETLRYVLQRLADPEAFLAKIEELYNHPEETSTDQIDLADGRIFRRYSQPQKIGDAIVGRVWSFRDITERRHAEEELRLAARTDGLTGLPNRALVCDRLHEMVLRSRRQQDYHFGVLFLDFDRFKIINDSLGHNVGDQLLQEISRRLQAAVRSGDCLGRPAPEHVTARLGGDEFVILLDDLAKPEDAQIVAGRLLQVFAEACQLGEHKVYTSASIGIVTSDLSSASADEVLRDADTAMYEAKLAGKGQFAVFDVSMRQRVRYRMHLENDLRNALDAGQLFLMYQPIVSLQTGRIESFEALLRWKHPEHGFIPADVFIPIAEDTGLILPIGEWVLHEACRQFARWRTLMGPAAPRSISVNLSRKQLLLQELPAIIRQVLAETGMTPECLHLEVTESAVMKDAGVAVQMLRQIKDIGVKLDMDDFGTGYSSLACLHQFPIDVLKIDRSFISNIDRGRDFAALVHAVAQLARNLNISVVAEGIETATQVMMLQSLECEFGQGYLFSSPLLPDQVPEFRVGTGALPGQAA